MKEKFRNKYRIKTTRLPNWDYGWDGYYFITICTHNRINWFGEIVNGEMILSDFGNIVKEEWNRSFEIRDELTTGEFVIMPNHLHAIVIIKSVETYGRTSQNHPSKTHDIETNIHHDLKLDKTHVRASLQRKPKSLSSFVAGFKSATINAIDDSIDNNDTKTAKFNRYNQLWQPRYYDHIIRNEEELNKISQYITDNPINWKDDDLFFEG